MKKITGFRRSSPIPTHFFLTAAALFLTSSLLPASSARAGTFNLPNFIAPGTNAFGLEPEVTFTHESGFATNLRLQTGVDALSNAHFVVGTGGGQRNFRAGGAYTFDFFPDLNQQPGIGIAVQAMYYRYSGNFGQLEPQAIPYIHKAFDDGHGTIVEPFLSVPVGFEFRSDTYSFISTLAFGARIYPDKKGPLSFIAELGLSLDNTESYLSGGVVYTP